MEKIVQWRRGKTFQWLSLSESIRASASVSLPGSRYGYCILVAMISGLGFYLRVLSVLGVGSDAVHGIGVIKAERSKEKPLGLDSILTYVDALHTSI